MKTQDYSDDQLMAMVKQTGDHAAFKLLLKRYQKPLFGYMWRFTGDRHAAEDLLQETYMRIYQARTKFNEKFSFSGWAYRIATNACLDMRKKKSHAAEKTAGEEIITRHPSPHAAPEDEMLHNARNSEILQLLAELPEKFRAVLLLKHYEDLSIKAIAAVLDIPEGTVKSRLYKGIKQLTELAEKRGLSNEV